MIYNKFLYHQEVHEKKAEVGGGQEQNCQIFKKWRFFKVSLRGE